MMVKTRYVGDNFDKRDIDADGTKLDGIASGSDVTGDNAPQSHNHPASEVTDFDIEVGNNTAVTNNTAKETNATHTGDVTGSGALTIAADAVTYAKMQNVVSDERLLGRVSGADGVVEELTKAQTLTMLNVEDGAEANNISDANATDLTDAGASTLHYHTSDRLVANISDMGTQSFQNILSNGDFESWSVGDSAAPDGWVYTQSGTGGTVTRIADTKINTYVARLATSSIYKSSLKFVVPNFNAYKGKKVTFLCFVKSANTIAGEVVISIRDSGYTNASYQNSGNWELISLTITVNSSTTLLECYCSIDSDSTSTADFVGAMFVEGSVCPAFSTKPIVNDGIMFQSHTPASATANGIAGQWSYDTNYIYICTATNTWKRIAIATW